MAIPTTVRRRTLSVDEYHKMAVAGIFQEDDRVELIEGELVAMAPIGGTHLRLVNVLSRMIAREVGDTALVSTQNPILLPPKSEPQPDIVLLKPDLARRNDVPSASDVLLVIEVVDTAVVYDRDVKIPLYARYGIPEVWLIDAPSETLSIYVEPGPKGYRRMLTPARDAIVRPSRMPRIQIRLSDIWLE